MIYTLDTQSLQLVKALFTIIALIMNNIKKFASSEFRQWFNYSRLQNGIFQFLEYGYCFPLSIHRKS